jgi:hypothetical protein
MNSKILQFRNCCAEDGIELTPKEAKNFFNAYKAFRDEIREAVEACPTFYQDLCNRTTEQKLEDIKRINEERGDNMTLKDYNQLQAMAKKICEIDGYA